MTWLFVIVGHRAGSDTVSDVIAVATKLDNATKAHSGTVVVKYIYSSNVLMCTTLTYFHCTRVLLTTPQQPVKLLICYIVSIF